MIQRARLTKDIVGRFIKFKSGTYGYVRVEYGSFYFSDREDFTVEISVEPLDFKYVS